MQTFASSRTPHRNLTTFSLGLSLAAFLLGGLLTVHAADSTTTPAPRFDLEIAAGLLPRSPGERVPATLRALTDYIRGRVPEVNFVLSPGTDELEIEDLRLRNVTLDEFLQALTVVTDGRVQWRPLGKGGTGYSLISAAGPSKREREVEVFNLTAYFLNTIGPKSAIKENDYQHQLDSTTKSLLAVIEDTVAFAMADEQASKADLRVDFRFHSGANLLVAVGTPRALSIVRKVAAAVDSKPAAQLQDVDLSPQPKR